MSLLGLKELSCLLILIKPNGLFHPTYKNRVMPIKFIELLIDGISLERGTITRFLGIFMDENVTRKDYTNTLSTKIS